MTKHEEIFQQMLDLNAELFARFKKIHDQYSLNPKTHQDAFNEIGREVTDVIRDFENRLCSQSEKTRHGKFTTTLSDKFWEEIRAHFPKIDAVGLIL